MDDKKYMQVALDLALKGIGKTSPNPMVGAVIVKNKRIISKGYHARCGSAHAEVIALKKAGKRAKGSTLYVTLEPCSHFGRTPPCVDTIIKSGIKKVVISSKDPNPINNGKSVRKLKKAGIKTKVGVLKKKALAINEPFVKFITKKMPFVVAKSAQTLDGKIATFSGQSKWITSKASRAHARRLRNNFDAIMVGKNTIMRDNPKLNAAGKNKKIKKVIVDSNLKLSQRINIFKATVPGDVIIATSKKAPRPKIAYFSKKGINIIICPILKGKINLKFLFRELAKKNITSVLIEGGSEIIGNALKNKLVDKMTIFIAPKVLGDQRAVSLVRGLNTRNVNKTITLRDAQIKRIAKDIFITGHVCYNK